MGKGEDVKEETQKENVIIVKGKWYEEIQYDFLAICPKCQHIFDGFDVNHFDGEKFTKTLKCTCGQKIKIKTDAS